MSEDKLERISALMDGELDSRERDIAIENIEVDPDTKRSWQRYHMIGDTMRNTMPATVKPDLATKLNEMLENEPAILAPKSKRRAEKKVNHYVKPLAGLAIAASVTAVAIIGLQSSHQQTSGIDAGVAEIAANGSENQSVVPTIESSIVKIAPTTVRTVKYEPVENTIESEHLNSYILNHNQFNSRMGVQGVSPNARLVGHEAGR